MQITFSLGFMGDQDQIFLVYLIYMSQTRIHKLLPRLVLKQDQLLQ